jgi:hypothetical protein
MTFDFNLFVAHLSSILSRDILNFILSIIQIKKSMQWSNNNGLINPIKLGHAKFESWPLHFFLFIYILKKKLNWYKWGTN